MRGIETALGAVATLTVPAGVRRVLVGDTRLEKTIGLSLLLGIIEGLGLFFLVPAATAMILGQATWGLTLTQWVILEAVLAVMGALIHYLTALIAYQLGLHFLDVIHVRVGHKVATAPLGWFTSEKPAMLSRTVSSELMQTGSIVAHALAPLHSSITAAITITLCCWGWDWRIGLAMSVAIPFFLALAKLGTRVARIGFTQSAPVELELSTRIAEFATCQPELRSAGRATSFDPLIEANKQWWRVNRRAQWISSLGLLISGTAGQTVVVALILVATVLVDGGVLVAAAGLGFIMVALRMMETLNTAGEHLVAHESYRPQMQILDSVFDIEALPEPTAPATLSAPGEVSLRNAYFSYLPNKPVLRGINVDAPAKSLIALVGPSGCGKTTAALLISRFYDVDSGSISVGGVDVREQPVTQLLSQISMVFQDVYLFDDTLEANIAIGDSAASPEEVRRVAELAGVGEIARRLPDGWDTRVGEGGKRLSGGERQRVSVARALLKKADVVLLDEATSSLDPENEANIVRAVEQLRRTSTVIVIAHKLHTIAAADRIYMFTPDGRIDDSGQHEELLKRCPRYQDFWNARTQAAGWSLVSAD